MSKLSFGPYVENFLGELEKSRPPQRVETGLKVLEEARYIDQTATQVFDETAQNNMFKDRTTPFPLRQLHLLRELRGEPFLFRDQLIEQGILEPDSENESDRFKIEAYFLQNYSADFRWDFSDWTSGMQKKGRTDLDENHGLYGQLGFLFRLTEVCREIGRENCESLFTALPSRMDRVRRNILADPWLLNTLNLKYFQGSAEGRTEWYLRKLDQDWSQRSVFSNYMLIDGDLSLNLRASERGSAGRGLAMNGGHIRVTGATRLSTPAQNLIASDFQTPRLDIRGPNLNWVMVIGQVDRLFIFGVERMPWQSKKIREGDNKDLNTWSVTLSSQPRNHAPTLPFPENEDLIAEILRTFINLEPYYDPNSPELKALARRAASCQLEKMDPYLLVISDVCRAIERLRIKEARKRTKS